MRVHAARVRNLDLLGILLLGAVLAWTAGPGLAPSARYLLEGEEIGAASLLRPSPVDPDRPGSASELSDRSGAFEPEAEEREWQERRDAWIESMHRAPGVDWRSIELANRRAASLDRFARLERGERTGDWSEIGSANQAGRTETAWPAGDGAHLYVGNAMGGVWRGTLTGQDWEPISDGLGLGCQRVLAVPSGPAPGDPEVVISLSTIPGFGTLHATTDGGMTWFVPEGLPTEFWEWKRILPDPAHPRHLYLLSRSRVVDGGVPVYGFFLSRSIDGGLSWESPYVFPALPRCDLWIDRVDGGDLWVMAGNVCYRSTDQGASFEQAGTAAVGGTVTDVILSGSEAGAPTLYAAMKINNSWQIYRSSDAGAHWLYRSSPADMWTSMTTSVTNSDVLIYGSVEAWRSTDGALSFSRINAWGDYYGDPQHRLHADIRGMETCPTGGLHPIFFDTDGGTFVSYDDGATVTNLSLWGMGVGQYYSTYTSATDPYMIAAGSQDQGYQRSTGGGAGLVSFVQMLSGDYGHLTSTVRNHNLVFCTYPGFILYQMTEAYGGLGTLDFPAGDHLWLPAVVADPFDEGTFYYLGDRLWNYDRIGTSYTFQVTAMPDFGSGLLSGLAISTADPVFWYAAQNNGSLWYSHDRGLTWTEAGQGPNGHWFYGTTLVVSPSDRDRAWVGGSGYLGHAVWRTTDGGANWEGVGDGLPSTLVYELVLGGDAGDRLFAATEAGPYAYDEQTGSWAAISGTEAPITTYWCVEWVPENRCVRFGTYGRGIWDYQLPSPAEIADGARPDGRRPAGAGSVRHLAVAPNPLRDRGRLSFDLDLPQEVEIALFDVTGRRVADLHRGRLAAGRGEIPIDLARLALPRGIYLVRVQASDGGSAVTKLEIVH